MAFKGKMQNKVDEASQSGLRVKSYTTILSILILKISSGPEKLPGLSRNGPQGSVSQTPDNFPDAVSIFLSSFIYQLMVIIAANLAIYFTKL